MKHWFGVPKTAFLNISWRITASPKLVLLVLYSFFKADKNYPCCNLQNYFFFSCYDDFLQ